MTATIAPLIETDLPEATRIFRVAFGTFLGASDPETFWSDRDYLHGRWHAPHVIDFEVISQVAGQGDVNADPKDRTPQYDRLKTVVSTIAEARVMWRRSDLA